MKVRYLFIGGPWDGQLLSKPMSWSSQRMYLDEGVYTLDPEYLKPRERKFVWSAN